MSKPWNQGVYSKVQSKQHEVEWGPRVSYIGHRVTDSGFWNEEEGRTVVLFPDISHTTSAESSLSEYKPNF